MLNFRICHRRRWGLQVSLVSGDGETINAVTAIESAAIANDIDVAVSVSALMNLS